MIENGTGSVGGNSQNIPDAHTPRTYSSFDLKAHRFNTERFGEYTPIIAFESVKEDKLPIRLAHSLRSYTMSNPLLQDLTKVKELFAVPMEAILPLNWEKFFDNPVRGDDVPVDVGPTIENFWLKVSNFCTRIKNNAGTYCGTSTNSNANKMTCLLRYLILLENFYSDGSLMTFLGYHGAPYLRIFTLNTDLDNIGNRYYTFDQYEDFILNYLQACTAEMDVVIDGTTYYYRNSQTWSDPRGYSDIYVPLRHIISLLRDDPTGYVTNWSARSTGFSPTDWNDHLFVLPFDSTRVSMTFNNSSIPFNTQFLSAYQLCCAHYFTNDHVDYIYSAELYRQLIGHYANLVVPTNSWNFTRNGIQYRYDYLSAHILEQFMTTVSSDAIAIQILTLKPSDNVPARMAVLGFFSAFFGFRRSLKYLDYFTGSRTSPLAVGSVNVNVTGTTVNVVDITRNIQKQRFLNSINRIGHKFENYLKGLFGGSMPAPDYHNPFDLAKTVDTVFGSEVENTGAAQVSQSAGNEFAITTNLRAKSNDYLFEIQTDRPCVIIAISYYDIPRVHLFSADRSFFHVDRFDYFNPFFQYTGDQPVYQQELGIQPMSTTTFANFGYSLRHMEYKQLYNSAAGGFIKALPGLIFPAIDRRGNSYILSPEWIRCVQSEFDSFYKSITGFSLSTYFHFLVDNFIDFSGTRPMAFAPQILG